MLEWAKGKGAEIAISASPQAAVKGAHLVVTDTWVSMGDGDGEDHDDHVHDLVGGTLGEPLGHQHLLEQIAQHQHGDQRRHRRQQQVDQDADDDDDEKLRYRYG